MRRSTLASLATLTTLALTSPAMADTTFRCEDGTNVVLYDAGREMRISGVAEGFAVALPLAHAYADSSVWTPRTFYEEDGQCTPEYVPCVQYDFPSNGPDTLTYQLSPTSSVVRCAPEGERLGSLYRAAPALVNEQHIGETPGRLNCFHYVGSRCKDFE